MNKLKTKIITKALRLTDIVLQMGTIKDGESLKRTICIYLSLSAVQSIQLTSKKLLFVIIISYRLLCRHLMQEHLQTHPNIPMIQPSSDPQYFKIARYLNVILKNSEKIDNAKRDLFTEEFDLLTIFNIMDSNKKGWIDTHDFQKLIIDNGADAKVFKMEKIMRYFGAGKQINKAQFLKAIALPPWKISVQPRSKYDKPLRLLFKLVIAIYLAIEEDDAERLKIKDINVQSIFKYISQDGEFVRISELAGFLVQRKFPNPDSFGLLRFMHNRLEVNLEEFSELFKNSLPQRFQLQQKRDSITSFCNRNATVLTGVGKLKKKQTTDTDMSDFQNMTMNIGYSNGCLNSDSNMSLLGKRSVILERSTEFQQNDLQVITGNQKGFGQQKYLQTTREVLGSANSIKNQTFTERSMNEMQKTQANRFQDAENRAKKASVTFQGLTNAIRNKTATSFYS